MRKWLRGVVLSVASRLAPTKVSCGAQATFDDDVEHAALENVGRYPTDYPAQRASAHRASNATRLQRSVDPHSHFCLSAELSAKVSERRLRRRRLKRVEPRSHQSEETREDGAETPSLRHGGVSSQGGDGDNLTALRMSAPRALEFGRAEFFRGNFRSSDNDRDDTAKIRALAVEWSSLPATLKFRFVAASNLFQVSALDGTSLETDRVVAPVPSQLGLTPGGTLFRSSHRFVAAAHDAGDRGPPADHIALPDEPAHPQVAACLAAEPHVQFVCDKIIETAEARPRGASRIEQANAHAQLLSDRFTSHVTGARTAAYGAQSAARRSADFSRALDEYRHGLLCGT